MLGYAGLAKEDVGYYLTREDADLKFPAARRKDVVDCSQTPPGQIPDVNPSVRTSPSAQAIIIHQQQFI